MKILMFEGTPQEMQQLKGFGLFNLSEPSFPVSRKEFEDHAPPADELTETAVVHALSRNGGMTPTQRSIIKAIYSEGKEGIRSSEIAKVTNLPPSDVKSSMRTFGKRVAHTPGWPTGKKAFEQTWTGVENIYRLHPAMRRAIQQGSVVL